MITIKLVWSAKTHCLSLLLSLQPNQYSSGCVSPDDDAGGLNGVVPPGLSCAAFHVRYIGRTIGSMIQVENFNIYKDELLRHEAAKLIVHLIFEFLGK